MGVDNIIPVVNTHFSREKPNISFRKIEKLSII